MLRPVLLAGFVSAMSFSLPARAQPVAAPDCTANVDLSGGGNKGVNVAVVYRCRAQGPVTFGATERAMSHIGDVADAGGKTLVSSANAFWVEPVNGIAELHYTMDVLAYAQAVNSPTLAVARGQGVLTLLEGWLLEPRGYRGAPVIDIRVKAADGLSFATGLPKVGDAWRLQDTIVRFAGYSALGKLTLKDIAVPAPGTLRPGQMKRDGLLRLVMLDGFKGDGTEALVDWARLTAAAEANYWQGFTANQLMVGLVPIEGRKGVGFGRTVPGGGATVMVEVGADVDKRRLYNEWVLVHELIHTGMPFINNRGTWLMEGAATFVEPVIRARAGWKTEAEVWKEWIDSMPRGAPAYGVGLANAQGNQNYWAGAIFMLLSDLGIRQATKGAKGLEDCLGGVLWSGVDATDRLTVKEFATACDRASETDVVSGLVLKHYIKQNPIDLAALWKSLGVAEVQGRIVFDDKAPLAQWRKMIVFGPDQKGLRPVRLPWQS